MDELFGSPVPPQEPKFQQTNYGRVTPSDRSGGRVASIPGTLNLSTSPQTTSRKPLSRQVSPQPRGRLSPTGQVRGRVSPTGQARGRLSPTPQPRGRMSPTPQTRGRVSPLSQSQERQGVGARGDRLSSPSSGGGNESAMNRSGILQDSLDITASRLHNNLEAAAQRLPSSMDPASRLPSSLDPASRLHNNLHDTDRGRTGFTSLTGRLSPLEIKHTRMQSGGQAGAGILTSGPGVLNTLNTSSHNSSKISSTHSGTGLNQTKSFRENMNSTLLSPVSTARKGAGVDRLNSTATSQINGTIPTAARMRKGNMSNVVLMSADRGTKETLQSLALLAILSLLLSLLSLVFLLKLSSSSRIESLELLTGQEQRVVRQVTQCVCCLTICLDLSCLLITTLQFVSAVKLLKSSQGRIRSREYLSRSASTRSCSLAAFISSIPLFLIGIVLFIFLNYSTTPAIVSSIIIGTGIIFCGAAVVHNVFVCQQEKTVVRGTADRSLVQGMKDKPSDTQYLSHITLPHATLDLSSSGLNGTITARNLELSTLV